MKVAIVCDWLTGPGGAERVVLELHRMFPEAPIYTSQYDPSALDWFDNAEVRTLWLQRLPKALKKFLPILRARAFGRLNLSDYDLVISSSGAEAKGVKTGPGTIHITYCHAPTHYYWSRYDQYLKHPGFGPFDPLARLGLKLFVRPMRRWDYKAAQRPNYYVVNSRHTRDQVKKYYGRQAEVINPPVDVERVKPRGGVAEKHGYLIAGRQTPYKRFDLAVAACTRLDLPLKVIGDGPERPKLAKKAGPRVTFLGQIPDSRLPAHFQSAAAFIFPGIDDFGIVATEALAAGTPVIAYGEGGALEYVIPGKTGELFKQPTVESLAETLEKFNPAKFKAKTLLDQAAKYRPGLFQKKLRDFINKVAEK